MTDLKTAVRMAEKSDDIQHIFLNTARRDRILMQLQMMDGTRMSGRIRSFDKFSVVLEAGNQDHLIFKHAIAVITIQTRGLAGNGAPARSGDVGESQPL